MSRRNAFLLRYLLLLVALFLVGRVGFMVYNFESLTLPDLLLTLLHAVPQDFVTATLLAVVPWAVSALALRYRHMPLRRLLIPYYIVAGFVAAAIIVVDACMYEFWGFKLGVVILRYAASPEGATNSVSMGFIAARVGTALLLTLLAVVPAIRFTPHTIGAHRPERSLIERYAADVLILTGLFLQAFYMHVGRAYYTSDLTLCHAATNPVYAFFASWTPGKDFRDLYNYTSDDEAARTCQALYAPKSDEGTPSLLKTDRPDVLLVMVESYGAKFVEELGGVPGVAPQLARLIPEGVFFDRCYANSFRTDRGTASIYNGAIAYPTASLMTLTDHHAALPSLPRTFTRAGYTASYLMGGAMTNMGKEQYLRDIGFPTLYNDKNGFTPEELATGSWGADDSITAQHTVALLRRAQGHTFMGYQTLSSHEPFDVPYARIPDNKVLNAFAYTDECLGQLIDSLKTTPEWDNLLVIVLADHGFMYELSYQDPEFFHIPLLWLGGALREPRRIHTLMNQSDLAATLLAQLHLPHADYPWSRNVLAPAYRYPFVYSNSPAGLLYIDATGTTIYDMQAQRTIHDTAPTTAPLRLQRAKAILQHSYDLLDK